MDGLGLTFWPMVAPASGPFQSASITTFNSNWAKMADAITHVDHGLMFGLTVAGDHSHFRRCFPPRAGLRFRQNVT